MSTGEGQPGITVILPVRDGDEALLRRAVESVRGQSRPDWELLLADDGSREEAAATLNAIAETDARIRALHLPAAGVSIARNEAIRQARGEVVTFLDADDAFAPGAFAEAMTLLADPETDALWGGTRFCDAAGMEEALKKETETAAAEELRAACVELTADRLHQTRAECIGDPYRFGGDGGYINRGIAARFIRRAALLEKELFFPEDLRMYEDTVWDLRMMESLRNVYVTRIWYFYYDNPASASNRFHEEGVSRIEVPFLRIRDMLDLRDDTEYAAYTRFLMDSLRYIVRGFYAHPAWKATAEERREVRKHLYTEDPWNGIRSPRFRALASKRDRRKALLYRLRLLFHFWKRSL